MGDCKHEKTEPINTYLGSVKPENIIETNYQCTICGKVLKSKEVS
jgi:hypothetical protein